MFRDEAEAAQYEPCIAKYVDVLPESNWPSSGAWGVWSGLPQPAGQVESFTWRRQSVPPESIGHRAIRHLAAGDVHRLVQAALRETKKVFDFNRRLMPASWKWPLTGRFRTGRSWDPRRLRQDFREIRLAYLDTSTPLMQRAGENSWMGTVPCGQAPFS